MVFMLIDRLSSFRARKKSNEWFEGPSMELITGILAGHYASHTLTSLSTLQTSPTRSGT